MTDEEKSKTVTAKLTGAFYVGQRVRMHDEQGTITGDVHYDHQGVARVPFTTDNGVIFDPIVSIVRPL